MVLRINPSRIALWRSPTDLQIGTGSDALQLRGLTPGQERLLKLLYRGAPERYLQETATCSSEVADLLGKLEPVMLARALEPTTLSAEFIETRFAEICRAQASHAVDGAVVLQARQNARVFISDCGETTQHVAKALEAGAIATLVTNAGQLAASSSRVLKLDELSNQQIDQIDFAILISHNAVSPAVYRTWLGRSIAHISLVFDSDGVSVSPVIEASKTPCLSCFHEAETKRDSQWPALASQLLFSEQRFDDSSSRLFAAALACQRALQFVDSLSSFEATEIHKTGYRLSTATSKITEFSWGFDESCSCAIG